MIQKSDERFDTAAKGLSGRIAGVLFLLPAEIKRQTQEIRLRVNRPVSICCSGGIYFVNDTGAPSCKVGPENLIAEKKIWKKAFGTYAAIPFTAMKMKSETDF